MNKSDPYFTLVFWIAKTRTAQDVCHWFRDANGEIIICQIRYIEPFNQSSL